MTQELVFPNSDPSRGSVIAAKSLPPTHMTSAPRCLYCSQTAVSRQLCTACLSPLSLFHTSVMKTVSKLQIGRYVDVYTWRSANKLAVVASLGQKYVWMVRILAKNLPPATYMHFQRRLTSLLRALLSKQTLPPAVLMSLYGGGDEGRRSAARSAVRYRALRAATGRGDIPKGGRHLGRLGRQPDPREERCQLCRFWLPLVHRGWCLVEVAKGGGRVRLGSSWCEFFRGATASQLRFRTHQEGFWWGFSPGLDD